MSHEATNWAIKQRGLKPTTKIVLWHLCDRFNPDYGCFPSQARLAHDCEISRSTLNEHLGQLEAGGLLRRVPRIDPVTKRQLPTRYILGFERGFTPAGVVPCPASGTAAWPHRTSSFSLATALSANRIRGFRPTGRREEPEPGGIYRCEPLLTQDILKAAARDLLS